MKKYPGLIIVLWVIFSHPVVAFDRDVVCVESSVCIGTYCNLAGTWHIKAEKEPIYTTHYLETSSGQISRAEKLTIEKSLLMLLEYGDVDIIKTTLDRQTNRIYLLNEQGALEEVVTYWTHRDVPEGYLIFDYLAQLYQQIQNVLEIDRSFPLYRDLFEGLVLVKVGAYYVSFEATALIIREPAQYTRVMKIRTEHNMQGWISSEKLVQPW